MRKVKRNSTRNVMVWLADSADHIGGKTGATLAIRVSKDGGAFTAITPTVTEREAGWYLVALTASHTDTLGDLVLRATAPGADPVEHMCEVVAYDPSDATALGLSRLDADVSSRSTYSGSDTAGTTTLLARLTDPRATKIDNLDASVSGVGSAASAAATAATSAATSAATAAAGVFSSGEKDQIRFRLGLDGAAATPTATPNLSTLTAGGVWGHTSRVITGEVTVDAASKVGVKLASDGLDQISADEPNGVATNFRGRLMQVWARFFRRSRKTSTHIQTFRSDGTTVNTSQTWSESGTTEEIGTA